MARDKYEEIFGTPEQDNGGAKAAKSSLYDEIFHPEGAAVEKETVDKELTEAFLNTLGKGLEFQYGRHINAMGEEFAKVEGLRSDAAHLSMTSEERNKREAEVAASNWVRQKAEEERLRPLYEYLSSEGEMQNGIPRGEAWRKLIEQNSGLVPRGADYDLPTVNRNDLRAMYMLDPSTMYDEDGNYVGDPAIKWNDNYPMPSAPIITPAEDGYYYIDGHKYSKQDMENVVREYIPYAQSNRLWTFNDAYKNRQVQKLGYKNYTDYYNSRMSEIRAEADAIKERTGIVSWIENDWAALIAPASWLLNEATGAYQARSLSKRAGRYMTNANDVVDTGIGIVDWVGNKAAGFVQGWHEEMDLSDIASLGVVGVASNIEMGYILNKVENGEKLSSRERDLYRLWELEQEADQLYKDATGDPWTMASVGKGLAGSQELAAQIALSLLLTGGVGTVTSVASQGGKVVVKEGVKQGAKTAAKEGVKAGWKEVTKREAAKVITKNLGVHAGRAAIATPATPMMWKNFTDRRLGQYSLKDGKLVYDEQSWEGDLFKAYAETFYEIYSEALGMELAAVLNLSPATLGRMVGLNKWGGKTGEAAMEVLKRLNGNRAVRTTLNKVGIQGFTGELMSEVSGDILTSLTLMPFYDDYNMEFLASPEYWAEIAMVSGIMGAGSVAINTAFNIKDIGAVNRAVKARDAAFKRIPIAELADELKRISTLETNAEIADALEKLNLAQYEAPERAAAVEYIANDMVVKASYGALLEGSRMDQFSGIVKGYERLVYEGGDRIIMVETNDGQKLFVKAGDIADKSSMLNCVDAKGNKVAVLAENVKSTQETTVQDMMVVTFGNMFRNVSTEQSLNDIESAIRQMQEPTREKVEALLAYKGYHVYKSGDAVVLADGTQAEVVSMTDDGQYLVSVADEEGAVAMSVPVTQVLQPDAEVAEVQKVRFAQKSEKALEDVTRAVENAQTESAMSNTATEDVETLKEDEQELVKAYPMTEDGMVNYDAITDAKQYATLFAAEMGGRENAHAEVLRMRNNALEEAERLREKGAKMSRTNDVLKNKKAVAELEQRAAFYEDVLAILAPQEAVAESAVEGVDEDVTPVEYKVGDVVEHNGRVARVIDTHDNGVLTIDYSMESGITDNANTVVVHSEEVTPATWEVPKVTQEDITTTEEHGVGLVMNQYAKRLTPHYQKIMDAFAKLLKVTIVFVEDVEGANGYIDGSVVYLSWADREKGIGFLLGHEVTHRMQTVTPEQYKEFKKAARKYLGETEWKRQIEKMRDAYAHANKKRAAKAQAVNDALAVVETNLANGSVQTVKEQLAEAENSEDRDVAIAATNAHIFFDTIVEGLATTNPALAEVKAKLEEEKAKLKPQIKIDEDGIEDEVVADAAGKMSDKYFAIDNFVNHVEDSRVMKVLRNIWSRIVDIFTTLGARTEAVKARELVSALDKLIAAAMKADATKNAPSANKVVTTTKNGEIVSVTDAEKGRATFSLIGEVGASALDMAEEATIRMDNLAVAREMETSGKDAKAIRMATGWERGADGLWRYELMDAKVNLYDGNEVVIRKQIEVAEEEEKDFMQQSKADTKELRERTNSYLAEMRKKYGVAEGEETDAMTEEEIAHLQSLTGKEIAFEDYKERRRNELYNRRMALEAQLGYVKVKNTDSDAMIISTRLGHILHGKNADALFTAYPSLRDIEVQFVTDIRDGAFAAYATKGGYKRIELNAKKTPVDMLAPYILHEVQYAIQDIEGFAGGGNLSSLQSDENVTAKEAYDYYRKIAGEVEARNISARINMTPEERRTTLLSQTEDVAREDQVFLREGVEMAMSHPKFSLQVSAEELAEIEAERETIIETAKANGTYLKAPNGKDTNLTPEQWVDVRTSRFKKWFGDWEKAARIEKLRSSESVVVPEDVNVGKYELNRESAEAYLLNELRGEYTIVDTNEKVTITRKGAKKVTSHSVDNVVHLKSIAAIPQMLENAIFIEESAAEKGNAKYDAYRYYVCGLRIGNNDYTVRITIGVKGGKYYYDHSLTSIEKGNLIEIAQGFTPNGGLTLPSYAESKDKRIIPILQTNSSKIVDANGEPKVVWHGGQFGISNFTPNRNMHFGTKKAAMQRILDEEWGYDSWLVENEDGTFGWAYVDEYDDAYNMQSDKTFATVEEAMEDAIAHLGNEVIVKPYFLNIHNLERTDDASSSWEDAIEVVKDTNADVDGIVYENWYEDKGSDSYIAFNPNQIKSATDNVGTYNANNPDVRYSLITPEMDAAYMDAVNNGDMETAQQMVMEAAEMAGYINDESWRMNHRAPRKDEENANPFNTEKIVPEDFWEHPEWYTNIRHSSETRESYYAMKRAIDKYKRLMAEGKTDEADNVTITMYRGVDKIANKREASFRNGDWITPSRSYALSSAPYGKARVISQEVNLKDIWWDGNSINEWGYDDGANYGYRDTKNNRKLLDPVTYDDNGNIIPLSKRFNPKKEDIRYSISAPSSTDRMADITPQMSRAEYKAAMLEEAKRMASEGMDAQKIVDETGWIELEDGWHYYGNVDIVLNDAKSNAVRTQRWLESKRAVKRAQVRKLYAPLIKEQEALISDLEKGRAVKGRTSANYANAVEAILDGQAVESLPIEDQILVDIALGQKLRWEDEKNGSRRGLGSELGLANAKDEKMSGVTRGAKDYVEDYVAALVERNKGYENGIDDNDVRNAVIETFRSYPSRQAALDELSARYPNVATTEAREGFSRLEFERDEALAEIDAEHRATMEDFEVDPERYMREYEDAQAWNENIDAYTQSLAKARNEIKRLERETENAGLTQREKDAAISALKSQVVKVLRGGVNLYMRKREIQTLMSAVNEAQTTYAMSRAVEKAMWSIYEARQRMELTRLNNLLRLKLDPTLNNIDIMLFMHNAIEGGRITTGQAKKLMETYFKGVNGKGISIARYIDGDTATIMEFVALYSDLNAMSVIEGFNIDALSDELREALTGGVIDHKYVSREKKKAYDSLDESVKARMVEVIPIIRGLLEVQQLMNGLKQSSESYAINAEVENLKAKIDELNTEIAELENEGKVVKEGEVYKDKQKVLQQKKKQMRDLNKRAVAARIADADLYLGAMPNIVERLDQLNGSLEMLVREGRIRLSEFRQKQEERRRELVNMVIDDVDRPAAMGQAQLEYNKAQKVRSAQPVKWILSPLDSFDYLLREAARNAPDGEGKMWNYFAPAIMEAEGRMFNAQTECYNELSEKTKSLFGTDYDRTMRRAERTVIGEYVIPFKVEKVENGKRVTEKTTKKIDLTISQAMDILAMWKQPNGKETLIEQGFKESDIAIFKDAVDKNNPNWLEFQQWVVNTYLPAKRVKYNKVHREMNGVDMDYEVNYFPMRRNTQFMPTPVDISSPDFVNTPSSSISTGAIIKRQNSLRPFDLEASFFNVLKEHLVEMERWSEMAPVTRDLNLLLSSPASKRMLESVREGFYQQFVDAAKVATGNFEGNEGWYDIQFWQAALRRWASGRLAAKAYTALKQTASGILFAQYAKNPKFILRLLYHYVKGTIGTNIKWALENSAMFRKRWASGTAGYDLFSKDIVYGKGKTRLERFINDILKAIDKVPAVLLRGIALVDAFTSASGMRAVYEQEMDMLMAQGVSKDEATSIAMFRAEVAVNKTQQSSENLYLSPVQKSKGFVARSLTAFMNAPIAQARNIAEAVKELSRNKQVEKNEILQQEKARLKQLHKEEYANAEETIAKEKAAGVITNAEEETLRRTQLYKGIEIKYKEAVVAEVDSRYRNAKVRALLTLFLNAWIGPAVFNFLSIAPYIFMGDDWEEKKKMLSMWGWQTLLGPLQTLPFASQLVSLFLGHTFDIAAPINTFSKELNDIEREISENGFNVDVAMLVADFALEHGAGVDVDTLVGIYAGLESLVQDGFSREALLMAAGTPSSQVKLLARERKEGETAKQYATRLMRLFSIFETPEYEEYYNQKDEHLGETPFGMKASMMRDMKRNWEYAYRLDVMRRMGHEGMYGDMTEINELYDEQAKQVPAKSKMYDGNGNFRSVEIDGHILTSDEYYDLLYYKGNGDEAEEDAKNYIGNDSAYIKMVRYEMDAKQAFNDKFSEITNK